MPETGKVNPAKNTLETLIRDGLSLSGNEKNVVFLNVNNESGKFADISPLTGFDDPGDGRGLAITDWDGDGDLDAWISNRTGPTIRVLENKLGGRSIAFELTGTQPRCNRDAIGAKVEVNVSGNKLIRSLRAGDGYKSQSSKRLHFGLGTTGQVKSILVKWPDGSNETFKNAHSSGIYKLIQGSGIAIKINRNRKWNNKKTEPKPHQHNTLIKLQHPPNFPELRLNHITKKITKSTKTKTLVLLWQPECPLCERQLHEITTHKNKINDANIRVLALTSVTTTSKLDTIKALLKKTNFPFEVATIPETSIREIETLHRHLFYQPYHLTVPNSFILNNTNRLTGLARGFISIPKLLKSISNQSSNNRPQRITTPIGLRPAVLIKEYLQQGLPIAAEQTFRADTKHHTIAPQAPEILRAIGESHLTLRNFTSAERLLTEAANLSPKNPRVLNSLGAALMGNKNPKTAILKWRQAARLSPSYPAPRFNLGKNLLRIGNTSEAMSFLTEFHNLNPNTPEGHKYLAIGYIRQAEYKKSITHLQALITLLPDNGEHYLNLAKAYLKITNKNKAIQIIKQGISRKKMPHHQHFKLKQLLQRLKTRE